MRALLLALAMFASAPSFALDIPRGSAGDARVKVVDYDEGDVVAIYAFEGVATHIVFGQGEEVQAIASGFSGGWEAVNRGNHLYLKPQIAGGQG
ncbi:TrbG/VirB9 family P-type conjugative transfer protein [Lysobacter soli]|uniref:TrbG/VirB9 family P-type conjugative transfer protein n=1 Tax=Lysobacter soli TaxID=453783 RepID=UPI0037CA6AFB